MQPVLCQLEELQRAVLDDDKLLALQAELMKKIYKEFILIKVRFTEVIVAQIVASQGADIKTNN